MEINFTVLTYFAIGLFALNGLFRGWWKEAISTFFLILLVFLLQQPGVAASETLGPFVKKRRIAIRAGC